MIKIIGLSICVLIVFSKFSSNSGKKYDLKLNSNYDDSFEIAQFEDDRKDFDQEQFKKLIDQLVDSLKMIGNRLREENKTTEAIHVDQLMKSVDDQDLRDGVRDFVDFIYEFSHYWIPSSKSNHDKSKIDFIKMIIRNMMDAIEKIRIGLTNDGKLPLAEKAEIWENFIFYDLSPIWIESGELIEKYKKILKE